MLIKQRTNRDCAVCCLAMALNKTYEEAVVLLGDYYQPDIGTYNMPAALHRARISHKLVGKLSNKRALVSYMHHKGYHTYTHMMYWNGSEIIDPAHSGQKYEKIYRIIEIMS